MSRSLPISSVRSSRPQLSCLEDTINTINAANVELVTRIGDGEGKLDVQDVKLALHEMELEFEMDEIARLIEEKDDDKDGFITGSQFLACFNIQFRTNVLIKTFREYDTDNDNVLKPDEVSRALNDLGIYGFSKMETNRLVSRCLNSGPKTPFNMFAKLTTPGSVFMHRLDLVERERNGSWTDIVGAVHAIFGAFVLGVISYFPKPTTFPFSKNNITIPLVAHPLKSQGEHTFDILTVLFLILWASFFVLSLAFRGKAKVKILDMLSLFCALAAICLLLRYLNPVLMLLPIIASLVVGSLLADTERICDSFKIRVKRFFRGN